MNFTPRTRLAAIAILATFLIQGCTDPLKLDQNQRPEPPKEDPRNETPPTPDPAPAPQPTPVPEYLESKILQNNLLTYPELSLLLKVKDAQKTAKTVIEAGGHIDYDPNLGVGSDIPFLIATIPAQKLVDKEFVDSLNLVAASIDHPSVNRIRPLDEKDEVLRENIVQENDAPIYVPTKDIKVDELEAYAKEKGVKLGEGTVIAVIDTGVDASHEVFQDRVVYWHDATQETRMRVQKLTPSNGAVSIGSKKLQLPEALGSLSSIYAGLIDEAKLVTQLGDDDKTSGQEGMDINQNGLEKDQFAFVILKNEENGKLTLHVDVNDNGILDASEVETAIYDFNEYRAEGLAEGFVRFPGRQDIIAFPALIEKNTEGLPTWLNLGIDFNSHGTHVSGIAAGRGDQIVGAAPWAKIMSLKVCTGITCTEAAILRGLIKAFYNEQGIVPDVVNISLGSSQYYTVDLFSLLMRDLSAKFGATFIISASNEGPGYRSINSLGAFAPSIHVGAHVSKNTLEQHYKLSKEEPAPEHGLLFFSSVGPSFNGQLRPHIVGPGSAFSSTPLTGTGSGMYNGTSMSAPIISGAVAAMLSVAKTDESYAKVAERKAQRAIKLHRNETLTPELRKSLTTLPIAIRTSLQDSASEMPGFSKAQVGYGLVNIRKALDVFVERIAKLEESGAQLFDLKINNNAEKGRMYSRSVDRSLSSRNKTITLSLVNDGVLSNSERNSINQTRITVRLEKVEAQSYDGSVATLADDASPFWITAPGRDADRLRETTILMNNRRVNAFISSHDYRKMDVGKTYLAEYSIWQNGLRTGTLVDVVHKAHKLSYTLEPVEATRIDPTLVEARATMATRGQVIGANIFHRYPIEVTDNDSELKISLGFSDFEARGRLYLQVYNQNGHEVKFDSITFSDNVSDSKPETTVTIPTLKAGIYEVTVANGSGNWMGLTKYDLLVQAHRFKADTDHLKLSTGESKTVDYVSSAGQVDEIKASLNDAKWLVRLKDVKVTPNQWSYRRVPVPAYQEGQDETVELTIQTSLELNMLDDSGFFGRVDHRLFRLKEDGSFEVAYKGELGDDGAKVFKEVKRPAVGQVLQANEVLYAAIETFHFLPEDSSLSEARKAVDLDVTYSAELDNALQPHVHVDDSQSSVVYNVRVDAPAALGDNWASASQGLVNQLGIRATLSTKAKGTDISSSVPVTIFAK